MELLNISNEAYHADTSRVSKSGLDLVARSPLHYWHKYLNPDKEPEPERPAFIIGTATHSAILEPEDFAASYCAAPNINRRTNAGKEEYAAFEAANVGKIVLDPDVIERLTAMRRAVFAHSAAAQMLSEGVAERTLYFTHPETGIACKIRPDFYHSSGRIVVDLKTTEDASPAAFAKSIANYGYDKAAAFYTDGFAYAGVQPPEAFVMIAVEKSPPYAVACYVLPAEDVAVGREKYTEALYKLAECRAAGQWPAYGAPDTVQTISLPNWAR